MYLIIKQSHIRLVIGHRNDTTAAGPPPRLAAVTSSELQPARVLEPPLLRRDDHALRRWYGVSQRVIAIGVVHEALAELVHGGATLRCDDGVVLLHKAGNLLDTGDGGGNFLNRVNGAAFENKVLEFSYKRRVFVVNFVFAAIGGPITSIPNCGIQ